MAEMPASCGGCDSRWTGFRPCHCPACHRTFSGISCFDAHRVKGTCVDPAVKGLVEVDGIWRGSESFDPTKIRSVSAGIGS